MKTAAQVAVVFTCQWCGRQVELRSSDAGPSLVDAQEFLVSHSSCLHRVRQRRSAAH
ncbi:MAG TPA: hypothetical protein VFH54_16945 [Mycobacteriales bacterium]|nr:hypothetical protein [Mycobacteriales bacterium]